MAQSALMTKRPERDEKIPKVLLIAILVLCLTVLTMVGLARWTGMEPAAQPPASAIAVERLIVLHPTEGGGVRVAEPDGAVLADLSPETAGFVAGVHRALIRTRRAPGIDLDAPVRLIRWADGRISLIDPETDWRIEFLGFGDDNFAAFATFLEEM